MSELGLRCPICKSTEVDVVDTRPRADSRRRRYKCSKCGSRFSTIEIQETFYTKLVTIMMKFAKTE